MSDNSRTLIQLKLLLVNFNWPGDEYGSDLSFEKKLKTKLKELILKMYWLPYQRTLNTEKNITLH